MSVLLHILRENKLAYFQGVSVTTKGRKSPEGFFIAENISQRPIGHWQDCI